MARGRRGRGGGGGDMMAKLAKMQRDIQAAQEELENETVEVTAGGGAIKITITGHQRVESIELDPAVVDPEDLDMLQDLLVAAVNQAVEESQAMAAKRLEGLMPGGMGGMGLPGF